MSLEQQQQLEASFMMLTYRRKPVEFVRGEGMHLYDDAGREYLDFVSGIGAVSTGHANPRVVQAVQQQAAKLLHVSNYYYIEGRGELAEKLSGLLSQTAAAGDSGATAAGGGAGDTNAAAAAGGANAAAGATAAGDAGYTAGGANASGWRSFFANSGAEAVEGAIKLARKYGAKHLEGADTIICARRSFHGRTLAALAATGQPSKQDSFKPIPQGFIHIDLNDIQSLKRMMNQGFGGKSVCAVLLECVQGEGGVYPCSPEFLQAARELTAEDDALLMIDEVQTGFYRSGGLPFSFQHYGILPDVVTMAKGLGSGMPIGAFAARGVAANVLEPGDHGSTFGGSPLAIAAANATLDELQHIGAGALVAETGDYLWQRLRELPGVTEIRGLGLMVGVEFEAAIAEALVDAGLEQGLVLNSIGHHILRLLPPLVCTKADIDVLVDKLVMILEQL